MMYCITYVYVIVQADCMKPRYHSSKNGEHERICRPARDSMWRRIFALATDLLSWQRIRAFTPGN